MTGFRYTAVKKTHIVAILSLPIVLAACTVTLPYDTSRSIDAGGTWLAAPAKDAWTDGGELPALGDDIEVEISPAEIASTGQAQETPTATPIPAPPTATPGITPSATAVPVMPSPIAMAVTMTPTASAPVPAEIGRGTPNRRQIALTFDAGASAELLPRILAALRQASVHATFFLTGEWVAKNPDAVKAIVSDGHELANHSYSHPRFTELGDEDIIAELTRTEEIVQKTVGRTTKPYFRPPYGARDKRVLAAAWSAGYRCVYWTVDSGDWRADATPDSVVRTILGKAVNGAIVVEHVGSQQTAEALPRIIAGLRDQGFEIVPLSVIVQ